MCGILCSVNFPFDASILDLLRHRGPDDSGLEKITVNGKIIKFGHRRLSILDLSPAGHQPMFTESSDSMIILNGEIYNHLSLREALPKEITFKGHSDTETIIYYLKEFGIDRIKDFNGIFSIAFLDTVKEKLYFIRDPFGVKPLYYFQGLNNDLIFSSEIRPIIALLKKSTLDSTALASLLHIRYNPAPNTLHQQIKKVKAGHYIEVDLKTDRIHLRHHCYLSKISSTIKSTSNNAIKLYGQKLAEAVKSQLLSDVEVGILLSGGIDSALVAALAKENYNGKIKAFTIGFDGDYPEDEIADATETAEILGLEHYAKKISFHDFLSFIKKCTQIIEEPLATTSMIPMYFLSELASEHVKVVLTGQGADEPLGGYNRYKSEFVQKWLPRPSKVVLNSIINLLKIKNEKILRGVNAIGISSEIARFLAVYEVFKNEEIKQLISIDDKESQNLIAYYYDILIGDLRKHPVEKMMALDTRLNLADDLLHYTDKITMHFSLECRVPMLDLELVKFIESLPVNYKLNFARGKIVHKRFAREFLPDSIVHRKKRAFLSPTNYWFKKEAETIKGILLKNGTYFSKIFNQSYIEEIIKNHQSGYSEETKIFLLLSIYFWFESIDENHLMDV